METAGGRKYGTVSCCFQHFHAVSSILELIFARSMLIPAPRLLKFVTSELSGAPQRYFLLDATKRQLARGNAYLEIADFCFELTKKSTSELEKASMEQKSAPRMLFSAPRS